MAPVARRTILEALEEFARDTFAELDAVMAAFVRQDEQGVDFHILLARETSIVIEALLQECYGLIRRNFPRWRISFSTEVWQNWRPQDGPGWNSSI